MTDTSREVLIKKLRNIFNNEWVGDAVREAADMLEADKREPLSDEQIEDMRADANRGYNIERDDYFKAFKDAEAAHGIGAKP